MNCTGDHLFAGTALAAKQDRRIGTCDLPNLIKDRTHRAGIADEVAQVVFFAELVLEMNVLFDEFAALFVGGAFDEHRLGDYRSERTEQLDRKIFVRLLTVAKTGGDHADGRTSEYHRHGDEKAGSGSECEKIECVVNGKVIDRERRGELKDTPQAALGNSRFEAAKIGHAEAMSGNTIRDTAVGTAANDERNVRRGSARDILHNYLGTCSKSGAVNKGGGRACEEINVVEFHFTYKIVAQTAGQRQKHGRYGVCFCPGILVIRYNQGVETRVHITAGDEHNKMRLEDFLLGQFRSLSKMYLRDLVKTERCEVNGRWENRGYKLRPNDFVEITVDHTRGTAMQPQAIALDVIYEDDELIVINKPEDMLMHPSHRDNSGTLLNALAFYLNDDREAEEGEKRRRGEKEQESAAYDVSSSPPLLFSFSLEHVVRPGLPHRLDRLTSGLVVVTKTARAHRIISGHFLKKRVEKLYLALVDGLVEQDRGTIDAPIGRFADIKLWGVKDDGKRAVTNYKVRARYENTTLLELEPVTGRTNQLRIHAAHIGHPIVGDVQRAGTPYKRLCLHAYRLAFPHPVTREMMRFEKEIDFYS